MLIYSLLGVALIKVVLLTIMGDPQLLEVHDIAHNMLETGEMKYFLNGQWNYDYQFPVYPILLYVFYNLFGEYPVVALVLNLLIGLVSALFLYSFSRRFAFEVGSNRIRCPEWFAYWVTLAFLLHPFINYYGIQTVHPFGLDQLFAFALLAGSLKYADSNQLKHMLLFGLVLSLAMVNRPTLVVFALPFFWIQFTSGTWKYFLRNSITVALVGLLLPAAWVERNYDIYGTTSMGSSTGQNLWIGVQEETDGTANLVNGDSYYGLWDDNDRAQMKVLNSEQQSAHFYQKYLNELDATPGLWSSMYVTKLKNFWWFSGHVGASYPDSIRSLLPLYKIIYGLLLVLAIAGLWILRTKGVWLLVSVVVLGLVQAYFYVELRHRILIEPLVFMYSIITLLHLFDAFSARKKT